VDPKSGPGERGGAGHERGELADELHVSLKVYPI
jgi:hypothetical protein